MIMWLVASVFAALWIEHPRLAEALLFAVVNAREIAIGLIAVIVLAWAWRTR